MFEQIALNTNDEAFVSSHNEGEALQQLGELQLALVGGGIGTVTIG